MRIGEISKAPSGPATVAGEAAAAPSASRALVRLAPPAPARPAAAAYLQAPFLAHLLAVKDKHAQTCQRRRAEPEEAIAAYRASSALR